MLMFMASLEALQLIVGSGDDENVGGYSRV